MSQSIKEMLQEIDELENLNKTRPGLSSGEKKKLETLLWNLSSFDKNRFSHKVLDEPFKSENICQEIFLEPQKESQKKCSCGSRDLFNYGCRCGGV